jgi:hypothetical protein
MAAAPEGQARGTLQVTASGNQLWQVAFLARGNPKLNLFNANLGNGLGDGDFVLEGKQHAGRLRPLA